MTRRRLLTLGASAGVTAVVSVLLFTPSKDSANAAGAPARDFRAQTVDGTGRTVTLRDYDGQVVLLNVWATWCPPCLKEMPSMQRLHEALAERGLRVVAISIDDAGSEKTISDFVREHGLTFQVLHDPAGTIMESYGMHGVPETFLISRDGRILLRRFAVDWMMEPNRSAVEAAL